MLKNSKYRKTSALMQFCVSSWVFNIFDPVKKKNSAQDPFDFDALEKMDPDPGHFFKIY